MYQRGHVLLSFVSPKPTLHLASTPQMSKSYLHSQSLIRNTVDCGWAYEA